MKITKEHALFYASKKSKLIAKLKLLIIKHETLENILIKSGNTYDVVSCSVVDFDAEEGKYLFYVEGYSCSFDIDDIDQWCYAKDCF